MKNKHIVVLIIALALFSSLAFGAPRRSSRTVPTVSGLNLKMGDFILSPEVVIAFSTVSFGANCEYMITKELGFGGDLLFSFDGSGAVTVCPDINYHFDAKVNGLDLFVGGGPSIVIGFGGGSAFFFKIDGGVRYFFTPEIGGYFKFGGMLGNGSCAFAAFGCSIKLK
jgi:hypothetical protein